LISFDCFSKNEVYDELILKQVSKGVLFTDLRVTDLPGNFQVWIGLFDGAARLPARQKKYPPRGIVCRLTSNRGFLPGIDEK
jgi:hypothetical protein